MFVPQTFYRFMLRFAWIYFMEKKLINVRLEALQQPVPLAPFVHDPTGGSFAA